MRTGGAEALAFDVACLSGPEAALPHGAPGDRPVLDGSVLLFDFGAQVDGYRSDMTRTLFVGEPTARDLEVYELVARAQAAAITARRGGRARRRGAAQRPGRGRDRPRGHRRCRPRRPFRPQHRARDRPRDARSPVARQAAAETPLPSPTVFSVEPGVYLDGEMGVRIEDLIALDASAGRVERLTRFPSEVMVVGAG